MKPIYMYCRSGMFCLLAVLFAPRFAAIAQQAQPAESYSDEELYDMDLEKLLTIDIVTASKINVENESLVAGAVTVISREDIVNSGAKNVEEILRTVAGFDVIRTSFSPNTMIVVRGLHSTEGTNNKVLFLIDGHPFRSVFYGDATVFAGNMALNNIARIEIIRGPGSTLFGTGAFLGVINIVTRNGEPKAEGSFAAGSFGTYEMSASGSVASRNKKFQTTMSANHFSTDGPDIAIDSDIAREEVDPFGHAIGYTGTSSATPGMLNYARKTSQFNVNSSLGKFYLHTFFANSEDAPPVGAYDALTGSNSYRNTTAFGELGVKIPVGAKKGELLIKGYYDHSKLDQHQTLWAAEATQLFNVFTEMTYPQFGDMLTGPPMYYAAGEEMVYNIRGSFHGIGSEATLAYNMNNKVKLIAGTMYEHNRQTGIRTFANGNIFFEYDAEHFMYIGDRNYLPLEAFGGQLDITSDYNWNRNADRSIFAAYGQAEVDLVTSLNLKNIPSFLLTFGGRYDHYSDAGDRFNPRAALVLAP
ncbi:MAG TPA: TonB-dependent receptor plug domain-containing protein, partial [Chryseosolibacter sp.]|nr:TonB-dependent receptor plug domain-containing protein [Chryseosolibacter sp.]